MIHDKKDRIISLATETASRSGFEIYEVAVQFRKGSIHVDVRIDNGAVVSHDDCALFSRNFTKELENKALAEEIYLEVSSPGLKRKLRNSEEWKRFVDSPVKVMYQLDDRYISIKGLVKEAGENSVVIIENKKEHVLTYESIKHANLDY